MTEEIKYNIKERHSKAIELAKKLDIYWFLPEEFEKEIKRTLEKYPNFVMDIIDGERNLIFGDCIYREYKEDKQEIIEITDFIDNKERTMIHVKDFDKYLNENKCSLIYKFNDQRMVIYSDTIYVEQKKETKSDMQYI